MKIEYQELATKRGTLRGLLTTPDSESKNIIVMFHLQWLFSGAHNPFPVKL